MSAESTVYRAAWVLPVSEPPIPNGALRVSPDGTIEAVGKRSTVAATDVPVLELGDAVILPGLVNVHAHPELTVLRGRLEGLEFTRWLDRLTELKYDVLTPESLRLSTKLGVAESIAAGVTCLAAPDDAGFLMEAMVEAGLRGRVYREVFGPDPKAASTALAELRDKVDQMRRRIDGRVDVGISPHAPYTVSQRLFAALADYATAEALPVCIHVAESAAEEEFVRQGAGPFAERLGSRGIEIETSGTSSVGWLEETGILATRPLLVHGVHVDASDVERIAGYGASIAHCPISNAWFGHGVAPLAAFREAGIAVGLGSDSVASNDRVDILEEARFAALMQRGMLRESAVLSPEELLRLATLDGARVLGLDDRIGSLQAGKRADFVAVRLGTPHSTPAGDPVATLIHSAGAGDVFLTVVDGRVLYKEGEFAALDWPALAQAAAALESF